MLNKNFTFSKYFKFTIIPFAIAIGVIVLDQLTKVLAQQHIALHSQINFIPGLIFLTRTYNTGAAWGMFGYHTFFLGLFSLGASILFGLLICFYEKQNKRIEAMSLAVVLGGTIGNMICRFMTVRGSRPGVVDMIGFSFIEFPIFNIADIAIVCGFIVYSIMILFFDKPNNDKEKTIDTFKYEESDIHDS